MHDADHQQRLEMRHQANRRRRKRGALKGWIFNNKGWPSTLAKALSNCQLRAACHLRRGLHVNLGADVSSGDKVSMYRVEAS
jgi:hypothetical protein